MGQETYSKEQLPASSAEESEAPKVKFYKNHSDGVLRFFAIKPGKTHGVKVRLDVDNDLAVVRTAYFPASDEWKRCSEEEYDAALELSAEIMTKVVPC